MKSQVLVLGGSGLLGRALLRHAPARIDVLAPDQPDLPMEDQPKLAQYLREQAVDRIVLIAAWTQVDACETDPDQAFLVNGILPGRVAGMAERLGLPLAFMSTDYVFDGSASRPYREYDPVGPLGVYARSKWYGECAVRAAARNVRVVRSTGLYGSGGPDFVQAILDRLARGPVDVVTDEVNAPTWVDDLAPGLWTVALADEIGTWHLAARGSASRYEQARKIAELTGRDPALVRPTTHAVLRRPAPRPPYSVLDCQAAAELFGVRLPDWEDGLKRYLIANAASVPPGSSGAVPAGGSGAVPPGGSAGGPGTVSPGGPAAGSAAAPSGGPTGGEAAAS